MSKYWLSFIEKSERSVVFHRWVAVWDVASGFLYQRVQTTVKFFKLKFNWNYNQGLGDSINFVNEVR